MLAGVPLLKKTFYAQTYKNLTKQKLLKLSEFFWIEATIMMKMTLNYNMFSIVWEVSIFLVKKSCKITSDACQIKQCTCIPLLSP